MLNSGHIEPKAKQLLGYGIKNLHCYFKPPLGKFKDETLLPEIIKNLQFLNMSENIDHFKMKLGEDLIPSACKLFDKSKETITNELKQLVQMVQKEYIDNPSLYENEKWVRKVVIKEIQVKDTGFLKMFSTSYTTK